MSHLGRATARCARVPGPQSLSVRVTGPGCSWPRGCCAQRKPLLTHQQPAPWGRRSPKGTLLAPAHCFASCHGQALFIYGSIFTAGPTALLLFPQPSVTVPLVIASGPCSLGDGIVALGLPRGSSIASCSFSPSLSTAHQARSRAGKTISAGCSLHQRAPCNWRR